MSFTYSVLRTVRSAINKVEKGERIDKEFKSSKEDRTEERKKKEKRRKRRRKDNTNKTITDLAHTRNKTTQGPDGALQISGDFTILLLTFSIM